MTTYLVKAESASQEFKYIHFALKAAKIALKAGISVSIEVKP